MFKERRKIKRKGTRSFLQSLIELDNKSFSNTMELQISLFPANLVK